MFTILRTIVDGNRFDRYFKDYDKARMAMCDEIKRKRRVLGARVVDTYDEFRPNKGYQIYQTDMVTPDNVSIVIAIVDGRFEDEV